ncbi:MAG: helix-turn-helix domain-containing protein [Myxococcales bacterium]|nr:helix-turn-helix domain-containing protein [Myxococcales bacterium]
MSESGHDARSRDSGPHARKGQLIAVGGGRGGVGKTLLSVNLGVYLAQLGRHVVLCDADPFGSGAYTMLGLEQPPHAGPETIREGDVGLVSTTVPGLKLMPTIYDKIRVGPRRPSRASHWMRRIRRLDADYVVLNLGATMAPPALDAFHEANVSICVSSPEPPAIEATYRFCRALYARRLQRRLMRERFKLRAVERALDALHELPTPRELVLQIAKYDTAVANVAAAVLQELRPALVIGKTRLRQDLELGPAMASLSERYLGVDLDYLGYVEQDDAVWLTARRRRPLLIDAPTSKSSRNIERVARRILAVLAQQGKRKQQARLLEAKDLDAPVTLYKVLGVDRSASDDEIRRAFKLQRAIFREDSLPIVSLVDGVRMQSEQARIREAYDTLLDPARRRAYDMSVFPDDMHERPEPERLPSASEAELAQLQAELAREITAETHFSGALLQKARHAQGISVADIAAITKISPMHLRAIEEEDVDALPAPVYVRGFLQQIAKALSLDPTQVTRTYLKRVRAVRPGFE